MRIGRNSAGLPLVSIGKDSRRWHVDINEAGRGLIFNYHHWYGDHRFVYVAFWFTRKVHGRKSWFW